MTTADGHQNSYWHCCSGKSLRDDHLKELTAEVLGLESFDETVFLEQIDYISVRDVTHLTFHFNDGHTEERDYEFRKEGVKWTDELNIVAGLIQDGIYQNAHVAQNQADYNKEYETLTARYEKAKRRLDEVEAEIHDKNSRRKSIEHYLSLPEERKDATTGYDVRLWHGMVEFVTIYSKDDIRFTMKDGTEIMA